MTIDWTELRTAYEGGARITTLSKKFKRAESTIRKRAQGEGWTRHSEAESSAPRKRARPRSKPEAVPKTEDVMDEHIRLWGRVKKRLVKGLRNADVKTGLEELKAAKVAGEVLANVIKGERLAMGIPAPDAAPMSPFDTSDDEKDIASEMVRSTAPPGADAPVDGE